MRTPPRSATGRFERSEPDRCAVDVARALAVDLETTTGPLGQGFGNPAGMTTSATAPAARVPGSESATDRVLQPAAAAGG
ncbi:hypothetical protein [Streptomyces sp. NBC_01006]|uniref:hypothetical protein n=1 Tax=Streptomyces sp. NBC_01006 TaxID=2903716 RepID=UPI00386FF279|nr:hypothetical protein OG509_02540 [Streptomyces sp. NBC_01006]